MQFGFALNVLRLLNIINLFMNKDLSVESSYFELDAKCSPPIQI